METAGERSRRTCAGADGSPVWLRGLLQVRGGGGVEKKLPGGLPQDWGSGEWIR